MKQERQTRFVKPAEAEQKWYVIDATNVVLGRLASKVARIIRGKEKASFTPNMDAGDFVIVTNAGKVKLTGKRPETKTYHHYSGYPGGLKERKFKELVVSRPEQIIETAVWGMLPKNRLGKKLIKKLKVYSGDNHPHTAQQPKALSVKESV